MKFLVFLKIILLFGLIESIQCQDQDSRPRSSTAAPSRSWHRNTNRQVGSWNGTTSHSNNCDTKELFKTLNDRVSLLVTLDENDRTTLAAITKRLEELYQNNDGRLSALSDQQLEFLKRMDSVEHLQLLIRRTLDDLKGETDSIETIKNLRKRKWKKLVEGQNDLEGIRTTRQINNLQPTLSPRPVENITDINTKLDTLAIYLTSAQIGIKNIQDSIAKLTQTTGNLQKRVNNALRRKQNGQHPFQPKQPNYLSNYSPELPLITTCSQDAPKANGILKLQLNQFSEPFYVLCENDENGSDDWTVVLKRFNGVVNFRRDWLEYKAGFGNLAGEFFIGLEKLHALTASAVHELLVVLEDFNGVRRYAKYSHFAIAGEPELYTMNLLGVYEGNAGDSLVYHAGSKFSTFDHDNDGCVECNCAQSRGGGWWYNWCATSNLMGEYYKMANYSNSDDLQNGIFWSSFHPVGVSLKKVKMMIRPIDENSQLRR